METRDEWIARSAVESARNPSHWLSSADQLWAAAQTVQAAIVADRTRWFAGERGSSERSVMWSWPARLMLAGFAIENAAKGLRVARDPKIVKAADAPGQKFIQDLHSHGLRAHLDQAGFALSDYEAELVDELHEYVTWAGRYPVPTRTAEVGREHWEVQGAIEDLYSRLRSQLQQAARQHDVRVEAEQRAQLLAERPRIEQELRNTFSTDQTDGVVWFHVAAVTEDSTRAGASVVVCTTCHASMELGLTAVAAICRCGHLYVVRPRFDHGVNRWLPETTIYPAA